MRQQFAGHFRPTEKEVTAMWKGCIFAFDTNALLNLYRYTESTRTELFGLIETLGDRIHIPYQVMSEFFDNRYSVIEQEANAYRDLEKVFSEAHGSLTNSLQRYSRHSHIDTVKLLKEVNRAFLDLRKQVKAAADEHPDLVSGEDPVFARLADVLDGKVGLTPSIEARKQAEQWAAARMDKMIPPGCADKKKDGDRKLGDALIWREILELGRQTKQSIIFITDDVKDDWWQRVLGKTVGPLPQLKQEFFEAAGQPFHMYRVEQFMKFAGEFLNKRVASASLTEAAEVRQRTKQLRKSFAGVRPELALQHLFQEALQFKLGHIPPASPEAASKIVLLQARIAELEEEYTELKDDGIEPGTAMEADLNKRRRALGIEIHELRDALTRVYLEALGEKSPAIEREYYRSSGVPSKRENG